MKNILIACQGGVATSTVVISRLKKHLNQLGYEGQYTVHQSKVADATNKSRNMDIVILTTQVVGSYSCPAISGLPLLTGMNVDAFIEEVTSILWNA